MRALVTPSPEIAIKQRFLCLCYLIEYKYYGNHLPCICIFHPVPFIHYNNFVNLFLPDYIKASNLT